MVYDTDKRKMRVKIVGLVPGSRYFLLAAMACVAVAGCGAPPDSGEAGSEDRLKVALLSPGPVNDAGWNQLAYEGLQQVEKELNAQISQKQTHSPADFEADFRSYAADGYDVIIGHGFELQPAAIKVSREFPNVVFVITAGNKVDGNVVPIIPKLEEATYLTGVIAARMSRSNQAGLVGGQEIPPIKSTFEAFRSGALSVDPDMKIRTVYIGNWDDTASAREATRTLIQQGCDFIFHNADAAGRGAIEACAEADGVYAFGSNSNQNQVAPDAVLASAVLEIPKVFVDICRSVKEGQFSPREFRLTLENGGTSLAYNPTLKDRIPQEVLEEVEAIRQKIADGELKVERAHF